MGSCLFCGNPNQPTTHHIIPKIHSGTDALDNTQCMCRRCHDQLEKALESARAAAGAGRQLNVKYFIGPSGAIMTAGSAFLNVEGLGVINIDSPILGIRRHNKKTGDRYIEAVLSGNNIILISGHPPNSWVVYVILPKNRVV